MTIFLYYLIAINLIAAMVFSFDKYCAEHHRWRVPERVLHLFELLGGWMVILVLMRGIHHKCSKRSYYLWTYLIVFLWVAAMSLWIYLNYTVCID